MYFRPLALNLLSLSTSMLAVSLVSHSAFLSFVSFHIPFVQFCSSNINLLFSSLLFIVSFCISSLLFRSLASSSHIASLYHAFATFVHFSMSSSSAFLVSSLCIALSCARSFLSFIVCLCGWGKFYGLFSIRSWVYIC